MTSNEDEIAFNLLTGNESDFDKEAFIAAISRIVRKTEGESDSEDNHSSASSNSTTDKNNDDNATTNNSSSTTTTGHRAEPQGLLPLRKKFGTPLMLMDEKVAAIASTDQTAADENDNDDNSDEAASFSNNDETSFDDTDDEELSFEESSYEELSFEDLWARAFDPRCKSTEKARIKRMLQSNWSNNNNNDTIGTSSFKQSSAKNNNNFKNDKPPNNPDKQSSNDYEISCETPQKDGTTELDVNSNSTRSRSASDLDMYLISGPPSDDSFDCGVAVALLPSRPRSGSDSLSTPRTSNVCKSTCTSKNWSCARIIDPQLRKVDDISLSSSSSSSSGDYMEKNKTTSSTTHHRREKKKKATVDNKIATGSSRNKKKSVQTTQVSKPSNVVTKSRYNLRKRPNKDTQNYLNTNSDNSDEDGEIAVQVHTKVTTRKYNNRNRKKGNKKNSSSNNKDVNNDDNDEGDEKKDDTYDMVENEWSDTDRSTDENIDIKDLLVPPSPEEQGMFQLEWCIERIHMAEKMTEKLREEKEKIEEEKKEKEKEENKKKKKGGTKKKEQPIIPSQEERLLQKREEQLLQAKIQLKTKCYELKNNLYEEMSLLLVGQPLKEDIIRQLLDLLRFDDRLIKTTIMHTSEGNMYPSKERDGARKFRKNMCHWLSAWSNGKTHDKTKFDMVEVTEVTVDFLRGAKISKKPLDYKYYNSCINTYKKVWLIGRDRKTICPHKARTIGRMKSAFDNIQHLHQEEFNIRILILDYLGFDKLANGTK